MVSQLNTVHNRGAEGYQPQLRAFGSRRVGTGAQESLVGERGRGVAQP